MKAHRLILTFSLLMIIAATVAIGPSEYTGPTAVQAAPFSGSSIVRVYFDDLDTARRVAIWIEPLESKYEKGYLVLEVSAEQYDLLIQAGLEVEIDETRMAQMAATLEAVQPDALAIPGFPCYRTVEETFATAESIVASYPTLATWTDVGDSWEKTQGFGGYDMMVLRLTNSTIAGPKPKIFMTAAIHAQEYTTAELITRLAEYLVDNYGSDADTTWLLDHHEVHLMLHTNPNGRKKAETGLSWRKNTNQNYCGATSNNRGADLNRNFPFKWNCCGGSSDDQCSSNYHGSGPASEPETQAVRDYILAQFPDRRGPNDNDPAPLDATGIYLDIHSSGRLVLWPWGWTADPAPNGTQLQTLGRKLAFFNGHTPAQGIGFYLTDGTTKLFAYGEMGLAAYTIELGTEFFESCSYFENTLVPDNIPSLIYAIKAAREPYMVPAGPDARNLSLKSTSSGNNLVTLSATIDDTRYNNSNGTEPTQIITAAECYVDVPPWVDDSSSFPIAMSFSDGSSDSKVEAVEATIDTTNWSEGRHIIFVRGQDGNGNWGVFSAIFISKQPGGGCSLSNGHVDYCSDPNCGPCGVGQGDCDGDGQCQAGLTCAQDVGANYGMDASYDVCEQPDGPCDIFQPGADWCRDCGPCPEGQGDCDGDIECQSGLICAQDVGADYGWPPSRDVCEQPGGGCSLSNGHVNYCSDPNCGPCGVGQGDCDGDGQCQAGLTCAQDVGANYGMDASYDVCEQPGGPCDIFQPGADWCRDCGPCPEGQGDCDGDIECQSGLICAQDVGADYGWPPSRDVCEQPGGGCSLSNGHVDYCSDPNCGPCGVGEGDCDGDGQCQAGLTCAQDVGANYGMPANYDVCEQPGGGCSLSNGHVDYCSDPNCGPCGVGEGDCDGDGQCQAGLTCAQDVGANYGMPANYDVCEQPGGGCSLSNGHVDYCSDPNCGPCGVGEGDCDGDGQCQAGLTCAQDVGANYGMPANYDVCEQPGGGCSLSNGHVDYCSDPNCGPCGVGQGDCDGDGQCQAGLTCAQDVGANYGMPANYDVCEQPGGGCSLSNGHVDYCSDPNCGPCGLGEGDCDGDTQCQAGLTCAQDVGADYGWKSTYDVCEQPGCNLPNGHVDYCKICGPCGLGEGDCDGDTQCQAGLTCAQDVGADYGWKSTYDVCE